MPRSQERAQFLSDILCIFAEGGVQLGGIGFVLNSDCNPNADIAYTWVEFAYEDEWEDEKIQHRIDLDSIAHGLSLIRKGEIKYMSEGERSFIIQADRDNEAGDIDAVLATDIVEVAIFGEVVYG